LSADLRQFLDLLRRERPREIFDVRRRVSPRLETTAILAKLERSYRSPVLVFHDVEGCDWKLVTNVCGSMGRLALAAGCGAAELPARWAEACLRPVEPVVIGDGPVREVVLEGEAVDLGRLPSLVYHEHDAAAPYVTAGVVAARDPESGKTNLSVHRLMVSGRNTTGIYMAAGKHLDRIHRRYAAAGESMPVAVFVGSHPLWLLGATYTGSAEREEYGVIGALCGEPLSLVPCLTVPELRVPAAAELVLEGRVAPHATLDEGPFGEFTGYATGRMRTPVFEVLAMTHRRDPLFQDVASGHGEHLTLPVLGIEHHALEVARAAAPGVRAVKIVAPLSLVVVLEKRDDREPRRIVDALAEADIYTKQVIVVDPDVDPSRPRDVLAAVALHAQADRDVWILPDRPGTPLDPSCDSREGRSAKLGIDATLGSDRAAAVRRNSLPEELLDSIDLKSLLRDGS
jgi:UbiD family decarboxylase